METTETTCKNNFVRAPRRLARRKPARGCEPTYNKLSSQLFSLFPILSVTKGTSYFNDALGTTVGFRHGGNYSAWLMIWRDRNVPSMTTRRRVVMAMVVGLVCLPAVVMNFDSLEMWRCRRNWHAALFENPVDRIPDNLFGMKLRSLGRAEGMVRETIFRRIGSIREVNGRKV